MPFWSLLSVIELVLVEYALNQVKLSYLLVLRGFRIFRVLKLASKWRTLQNLIETLLSSLIDVFNVWVIYIMFLLTFALLGVNFFGSKMKFDSQNYLDIEHGVRPRANFDDILSAITSVFVLIGGEDWQYVMYDGIRSTNWFSVAYFVILVIFGQIILLNLVIAILVEASTSIPNH